MSCQAQEDVQLINPAHLNYLYEEINVGGEDMAIIHIYSNYPDYDYVGDEDEGIACVDDAARAAIFYLYDYQINSSDESRNRNKSLLKFLLYMQAENGYFYNFIWDDYSINKEFKTSIAEANWWAWRALWALSESYKIYVDEEPEFAKLILQSVERLIVAELKNMPVDLTTENFEGFEIPVWLPYQYGSDQAAVLILALIEYHKISANEMILEYIANLSEGIREMQIRDSENKFNGAFLSWQNNWHAWGNLQSYALLKSFQVTKDSSSLNSALYELDNFYTYLIKNNFLNSFSAKKADEKIEIANEKKYSQIAYNIRPMVYALVEAYKITGEEKYAVRAVEAVEWFFGKNPADAQIYFPENGIVYDGIESKELLNKNSGAESTIEGLLSLQRIHQNNIDVKEIMNNDSEIKEEK